VQPESAQKATVAAISRMEEKHWQWRDDLALERRSTRVGII